MLEEVYKTPPHGATSIWFPCRQARRRTRSRGQEPFARSVLRVFRQTVPDPLRPPYLLRRLHDHRIPAEPVIFLVAMRLRKRNQLMAGIEIMALALALMFQHERRENPAVVG